VLRFRPAECAQFWAGVDTIFREVTVKVLVAMLLLLIGIPLVLSWMQHAVVPALGH
jgi:hypothetical protein